MSATLSDQSIDVGYTADELATRWVNAWVDLHTDTLTVRRPVSGGWEQVAVFTETVPDLEQSTLTRFVFTGVDLAGDRVVIVARTPTGCKKGCK